MGESPLLTLSPLQPLENQGKEEEEKKEVTSGLNEVPSSESGALGCHGRWPGWELGEGGAQGRLAWAPRPIWEKRGKVVGARGKQINRMVETIIIKKEVIKVKNGDCVTPKTNRK